MTRIALSASQNFTRAVRISMSGNLITGLEKIRLACVLRNMKDRGFSRRLFASSSCQQGLVTKYRLEGVCSPCNTTLGNCHKSQWRDAEEIEEWIESFNTTMVTMISKLPVAMQLLESILLT
jgi:hypothetical protein